MSDVTETTPIADKDAATRIRQQRLIDARAKLKAYRARQGSKASVSSSVDQKPTKRESLILAQTSDAKQIHRRSLSKGGVVPVGISHNKRASHSRSASRGSISGLPQKPKGHGHTRSRASISLSVSAPAGQLPDAFAPSSSSIIDPTVPVASDSDWRSPQPIASTSTAILPPSHTTPTRHHNRTGSRHGRQSSISNFRESMEIVSGGGLPTGALQPAVGSFEGVASEHNSPMTGAVSPGMPAYINDSAKLLEALRERGRRESEEHGTNARSALEALEGRVGAPSEMISLGHSPNGGLLVAPKSPGFTSGTASPLAPSPSSSPMIGLGMSSKRKSWSAPDSVVAQGALGPSALGSLAEEDEEEGAEEEDAFGSMPSPKRKLGSPRRARPTSLSIAPMPTFEAVNEVEEAATSTPSKEANTSFEVSTPDSAPRRALRPLSLSVPTPPANPTLPVEEGVSPGEQRRRSIYQSVSQAGSPTAESALANKAGSPVANRSGGLRSLSISNNVGQPDSLRRQTLVRSDSDKSLTSPSAVRTSTANKRSSISYRNSINAEAPSSAGGRRAWSAALHTSNTPSVDMANSFFAYGPSGGPFGGFGDLEVEHSDDESVTKSPTRVTNKALPLVEDDSQVVLLKQQLSSARQREAEQANHFVEFEQRVAEEASVMKAKLTALEQAAEEANTRHTFAVEGLTRELEMAKEAINDLTEERDSLAEDVEGWRTRCLKMEDTKKATADDNLISAQSKLINQMRDQLYNLHASFEREKAEHFETREEVDRLRAEQHAKRLDEALDEFDEEAQIGTMPSMPVIPTRHFANNYSDNSIMSVSSLGRSLSGGNTTEETSVNTDAEDTFAHHKFAPTPSPPLFSAGLDPLSSAETVMPTAHSALDILVEEDEEVDAQDHGHRGTSGSTGSSASDVLPLTPVREDIQDVSVAVSANDSRHARGDSFVRKWRFPQGSVSSDRMDDPEEHSFFNLHKHASLPPLPIPETILPPFLCADLTYDDEMESPVMPQLNRAVSMPVTSAEQSHMRRPSSPRPSEMVNSKRISGQWSNRAPPVAASAYSHAAYQSSVSSAASTPTAPAAKGALARLSSTFSGFGSFGGWGGSQASNDSVSVLPVAGGKLTTAMLVEEPEEDEEDVEQTPRMVAKEPLAVRKISAASQPRPVWSPLRLLDFRPAVWSETNEPIYEL